MALPQLALPADAHLTALDDRRDETKRARRRGCNTGIESTPPAYDDAPGRWLLGGDVCVACEDEREKARGRGWIDSGAALSMRYAATASIHVWACTCINTRTHGEIPWHGTLLSDWRPPPLSSVSPPVTSSSAARRLGSCVHSLYARIAIPFVGSPPTISAMRGVSRFAGDFSGHRYPVRWIVFKATSGIRRFHAPHE
ncbi:hypothetical protein HN011_003256 [Eciton burchellii]|nr:hypothetical protein HN011_003256 [Eciton burchellii]